MNIGADVSYNFEPTYMSYMANTIIEQIKKRKDYHRDTLTKHYIDRERHVEFPDFKMTIKLSANDVKNIVNDHQVTKRESIEWIERCF